MRCACAVRKVGYFGPTSPDGQGDRGDYHVPVQQACRWWGVVRLVTGTLTYCWAPCPRRAHAVPTLCKNAPTVEELMGWANFTWREGGLPTPPRLKGGGAWDGMGWHTLALCISNWEEGCIEGRCAYAFQVATINILNRF